MPTPTSRSVEARRTAVARALAAVTGGAPPAPHRAPVAAPAARTQRVAAELRESVREVRAELSSLSEQSLHSQRQVEARLDALDTSLGARLAALEASVGRIESALDRLERSRPTTPRRDRGRLRTLPEVPSPDAALSAVLGDDPRRTD